MATLELLEGTTLPGSFVEQPHAVFADLHMSDRSAGDDFKDHEDAFWHALELLPQNCRITMLGDTFDDTELSAVPGRGFLKIKEKYPKLIRRLNALDAEWVVGNHDLFLAMSPSLWPTEVRCHEKVGAHGGCLLEHGHEADPPNAGRGWFGRAVTRIQGAAERLLGWQLDDAYGQLKAKHREWRDRAARGQTARSDSTRLGALAYNTRKAGYSDYAHRRCLEAGTPVFIYGHTHEQSIEHDARNGGAKVYFNVPSWKSETFLFLDGFRGHFRQIV